MAILILLIIAYKLHAIETAIRANNAPVEAINYNAVKEACYEGLLIDQELLKLP